MCNESYTCYDCAQVGENTITRAQEEEKKFLFLPGRSANVLPLCFVSHVFRSKYSIDLTLKDQHEGSHLVRKAPSPPGMDSWLQEEHKALSSGDISSAARPPALSQTKQNQLAAKKSQMAMAMAMKPGYVEQFFFSTSGHCFCHHY